MIELGFCQTICRCLSVSWSEFTNFHFYNLVYHIIGFGLLKICNDYFIRVINYNLFFCISENKDITK